MATIWWSSVRVFASLSWHVCFESFQGLRLPSFHRGAKSRWRMAKAQRRRGPWGKLRRLTQRKSAVTRCTGDNKSLCPRCNCVKICALKGGRTECKIFKYLSTWVFESILMNSEDDAMEEDVVVTTPVTPGVSLHYPQVFATKRISKIRMNYDLYQFQNNQHLKINTNFILP